MNSFVAIQTALWTDRTGFVLNQISKKLIPVFARINLKFAGIIFLFLVFSLFEFLFPQAELASSTPNETFSFQPKVEKQTASVFSEVISEKTQTLAFKSSTVLDETLREGETKIIQPGIPGKKILQTKTILHNGQEYSVETKVISEIKPVDQILAAHPSVFVNEIQTPTGVFKYREKLRVWATSYDPFCNGCSSKTSIGLKAGYGVIAVDPKVIPLRSKVYVPGYGLAIAGDTGGSIKGLKIDLGFDNVKNGNWSSRYTDIYILSE